jgi:uncharacterized protein (TIGR00369 family)
MSDLHHRKLETMYRRAPINRLYEPAIVIAEGTATIEIGVKDEYFHAARAVHGSVLFKMLDDACFFAVASLVDDVFVLTVSFTTYLTRPVTGGRLTSVGRVVHAGKTLLLAEAVVSSVGGKDVARGSGSFTRSSIPLTEELGYASTGVSSS